MSSHFIGAALLLTILFPFILTFEVSTVKRIGYVFYYLNPRGELKRSNFTDVREKSYINLRPKFDSLRSYSLLKGGRYGV